MAPALPTKLALVLAASSSVLSDAACPAGGLNLHGRCWFLSDAGASCKTTCQAKGLSFQHHVVGEADPMVPKLLGRQPSTRQFPWARLECYVPGSDRFHTSKAVPDGNSEDRGDPGDWAVSVCQLSCPCSEGASAPPPANAGAPYPECVEQGSVLRHAGSHAIFVDVSSFGSTGCWQSDCKHSDKFNADDVGICARACAQIDECLWWTFGAQEDANKCFLRKSDGGREGAGGWLSAAKTCAPPALPDYFLALTAANVLLPCDAGKSEACPDMARAVTTWKFAIKHLKKATAGKVDPNTIAFINQISDDTDAFAAQMSEDNFPVVVGNNRQVFYALQSWMDNQPKPSIDLNDASLPNPVRGALCGVSSCHDKVA
mmetsp:Transcript_16140/g.34899  ORF Transcript_16140/g.34899 Transcript_16140/m.34899 type:complete len:373 (+) Transcript_16140:64-1182(+)|eukprot:CAMPEP_0206471514 /NCGR_PEP_ID=MMETSP0324_2-20121206/31612_1 /ASSEMBLY_ACC=CAM_ASM_000836 /TAXON_ID=2866 /ORGANISM="Crypthecodinium cohnii, Strain Seligo" /LENGTH=372 /DNA_ID=CAMNT_0053945861 /DNA_START=61 /DNA_END=1179 /DNA_ORIENTATION=+